MEKELLTEGMESDGMNGSWLVKPHHIKEQVLGKK
jgi:hypothetical protein